MVGSGIGDVGEGVGLDIFLLCKSEWSE
jgi:hypothetical protein